MALTFVEWLVKAVRDAGMARLVSDPRVQFTARLPVFDGTRLIAAGFRPMLDESPAG